MKKITLVYLPFILILLFGSTSCSFIKPVKIVSVNSIKIGENSGARGIDVTTNLSLYNPNNFRVIINKADIDVYAEGVNLGKLKIPEMLEINANKEFSGDFFIEISFSKLLMAGKNVISKIKSGKFEIQLKGTIDTDVLWKHKIIQVNYTEKIDLK